MLPNLIVWTALGGLGCFLVFLVISISRGSRRKQKHSNDAATQQLAIDITRLDSSGPQENSVKFEIYGTPHRLAVLVLAPIGRISQLPAKEDMPKLVDHVIPNLMTVVNDHQPLFRSWPEQVSAQGFAHAFFNNLALPGLRGKNSNWCSLAGRFNYEGTSFLVGVVCCSEFPNSLGQILIEHDGQWLDVCRIKQKAAT